MDAISILDHIGNTPLFRLGKIAGHLQCVELLAKAEYLNPGGSVKDRAALQMVRDGIASGTFTPEKILLDSTSGNTGIAYAMIGAALGFRVLLVLPANVSAERLAILKMYGAQVELSDRLQGSDGAILLAKEIYSQHPDSYFKPDQYNNFSNPLAHYKGTGPEIWRQTAGRVTHFLATIGTTGTITGTSRFLKEKNPGIQVFAVEPDNAMHGIEGLKHLESSLVPGIYSPTAHDEKIPVSTEDAYAMQLRLAREEGIFTGFSAGAAVHCALELAEKLEAGGAYSPKKKAVVVTILCDRGDRYLTQLRQIEL